MHTVALLLVAFALVCCRTEPEATWLDSVVSKKSDGGILSTMRGSQAKASILSGPAAADPVRGRVAIRFPPSLADVAGQAPVGLPMVSSFVTFPVAEEPWTATWTTRPTASYPEGPGGPAEYPDLQMVLLVSLVPPPEPQLIPGGNGGMLMLDHFQVFVPNDPAEPALTQQGGVMRLNVTFPASLVGTELWIQALVADARVPAGAVPTAVLHLQVGRRTP